MEIVNKESYSAENTNIAMSKKEREDLILTIRNKIISDNVLSDLEDTVIDYFYIREIDMDIKTDLFKAKLDLLLVNQRQRFSLITLIFEKRGFNIEINKLNVLVCGTKIVDYLSTKGSRIDKWQRLPFDFELNNGINEIILSKLIKNAMDEQTHY